jgi:hypothetical protein
VTPERFVALLDRFRHDPAARIEVKSDLGVVVTFVWQGTRWTGNGPVPRLIMTGRVIGAEGRYRADIEAVGHDESGTTEAPGNHEGAAAGIHPPGPDPTPVIERDGTLVQWIADTLDWQGRG